MAGLAAALNAPGCLDAVADALAPRGADGARCRLVSAADDELEIAVRAAMPAIARVISVDPDAPGAGPEPPAIAALAMDGVASMSALDQGYAAHGPSGLVDEGEHRYAVILADVERGELVLARNGDGPGLYYARHGDGWLAASEPTALIRGGVDVDPDVETVGHFIATGGCDESERTFFAHIRRVLPGEVVVLGAGGHAALRQSTGWSRITVAPEVAVQEATGGPRLGVLLGPGLGGAAVLGGALSRPQRPSPVPVHTVTIEGIDDPAAHTPELLGPVAPGLVRHTAHRHPLDLDRFLRDVGEPLPDLGLYLMWAVVRELSGDIDTLVDTSTGDISGLERLTDRMLARYGVTVRAPLRESPPDEDVLGSLVGRTLPAIVAKHAAEDSARIPTAAGVLLAHRDEVAAALATARPWADPAANLAALRRLAAGETADAEALLRAYIVERWLAMVGPVSSGDAEDGELVDAVIAGDTWRRLPVRVSAVGAGDPFVDNAAWATIRALTDTVDSGDLCGPWFAVVSGKALAVSQRRLRSLLDVRPTGLARMVAALARRRLPELGESWTAQVVIDHSGLIHTVAAVLGRRGMRAADTVYPPRPDAMPPADAAVVRAPLLPDEVAATLVDALRRGLPHALAETLAGCAVASADADGCRVLGFAAGPYADAAPNPVRLLASALDDNPGGQGCEQTPLILVLAAPRTQPTRPQRDYSALNVATPHRAATRPS